MIARWVLVALTALLTLGGANLGVVAATAQGDVEIVFWNTLYPMDDPNDRTRPPEDFYISRAVERFEAANPGIRVRVEDTPGGSAMFTQYRTASVAQNGPDIMGLWSGSYMLNLIDFLEPLGPYFTEEERARITGWEAVSPDFDAQSDDIYGVPAGSDGVTVIFYNKTLMAEAGVDPEANWPTDISEFITLLDTIQESGVTPLVLEEYGYVWQILSYWMSQTVGGSAGVDALSSGDMDFSNPEFVEIVEQWQRLADYTVPGAESMEGSQSLQLFIAGQAAMTTGGFWLIRDLRTALGDDLGMIKIPDFSSEAPITGGGIGGPGTAFIVSNYSEHKDEAVAFIKFLMSAEEQALKAESGEGSLLNVTDVDFTEYYEDPLLLQQQEWANEPSTIFWTDNVYPSDLTTEIKAQAQLVWTDQLSPDDFLARLDRVRDESVGR